LGGGACAMSSVTAARIKQTINNMWRCIDASG
jgi:hypothetical protein